MVFEIWFFERFDRMIFWPRG